MRLEYQFSGAACKISERAVRRWRTGDATEKESDKRIADAVDQRCFDLYGMQQIFNDHRFATYIAYNEYETDENKVNRHLAKNLNDRPQILVAENEPECKDEKKNKETDI